MLWFSLWSLHTDALSFPSLTQWFEFFAYNSTQLGLIPMGKDLLAMATIMEDIWNSRNRVLKGMPIQSVQSRAVVVKRKFEEFCNRIILSSLRSYASPQEFSPPVLDILFFLESTKGQ